MPAEQTEPSRLAAPARAGARAGGRAPTRARWLLIRILAAAAATGLITSACSAGAGSGASPASPATSTPSATAASTPSATATSTPAAARAKPLAGKVVGIDPGHNGLNGTDPAYIDRQIWNGRFWEDCDTTGTETDSGYTEAQFNFNVASYLRGYLRRAGARVVMTRRNNHGVGPCVNRRAEIIDRAHASVAIDIHADGGPSWGRGFTVLEPVADGPNDKVITASVRFGRDVRSAFLAGTPMQRSDYYGQDGVIFRDDLAGLNLTTVPKVLIECGNMRNAADAALLTTASVQRQIARALDAAITRFLTHR
ncbi:MAG: N-acetylmuramoyl-L-alanine amidase [Streptosporangiaceae bacterium]